ncbi:PHP domain-containing protein [Gilvibacter sp.]|uniref:PHP domain-containing protein n=1 Tax=Gilvibacter sp. TaxID=2729997 RepID=UPI0035BE2AC2
MFLNTHTYYSLRYGTFAPEPLLEAASSLGIQQMAFTDINNVSACFDLLRLSQKYGIRPVVGVDFRNGAEQLFIALAKSHEGFARINRYLSHFYTKIYRSLHGQPHLKTVL